MIPEPLATWLEGVRDRVDAELEVQLPASAATLAVAMRYAALGPGKRVRPALMFAIAEAIDLDAESVAAPAAAVEMVHAFSLVHDDLPALDDDELRRGRETVHVAFDEATAVLVGDALLSRAFGLLAELPRGVSTSRRCCAVAALARAVGEDGMIGGQMLDLESSDGSERSLSTLDRIHRGKTGALMRLCAELPVIYAGVDKQAAEQLARTGEAIGLLFQIRDDLLDVTQVSEVLGKTAGKDERQQKLTYPSLVGVDAASRRLDDLRIEVMETIALLPGDTEPLAALVNFIADRSH